MLSLPPARVSRSLWDVASFTSASIGRRQLVFAGGVVLALLIGAAIATPFSGLPLAPVPGLLVAFSTSMIVINVLLATLLFIKGRVEDRQDTIRLGAAYLFVGLIIIPQTLSFPGALMPAPIIGTQETALWFWIFWHTGFALAVTRYAWRYGPEARLGASLLRPIGEILLAVAAAIYVAVVWGSSLPPLMLGAHFVMSGAGLAAHAVVCLACLCALVSVLRLRGATPEQLWLAVGIVASCVEVWLTLQGTARFTLGWYLAKAGNLTTSMVVLVSLMHEISRLYAEVTLTNRTLVTLARRDGLTGLSNRRHFDELLSQEFRRARRQELPLALIMIDIDHFKKYNDSYGHPAGDETLRRVASAVESTLRRPGDHAARYGGEEMAALLPATDLDSGHLIAERIRAAVAAEAIPHGGSPMGLVTVSVGVAAVLPLQRDDMAETLLKAADQALYRAKSEGRNRVCAAPATTSPIELPAFVTA